MSWEASEDSYMENEEAEQRAATGKTQVFVQALYKRKSLDDARRMQKSQVATTMSRTQTVVWRDCERQLKCVWKDNSWGRGNEIKTWMRGECSDYNQDKAALLQCEQTWRRRQDTAEVLVRMFWQRLTGLNKSRPASASQSRTIITDSSLPRSTKAILSPAALHTRRSFVKYAEAGNTASTPVLVRQIVPLFPDVSYSGQKTPGERAKSSRKLGTRGTKSPVHAALRGGSEHRLLPSLGVEWQQVAALPRKPGKRLVRKGKSQSKLAGRLRATPYNNV